MLELELLLLQLVGDVVEQPGIFACAANSNLRAASAAARAPAVAS